MSESGKLSVLRGHRDVARAAQVHKHVGRDHPKVREPCERILRLAKDPVTAAVLGEFSAGKSSFLNRLLGADLPVSVLPMTATVTRLVYGRERAASVEYRNGDRETIAYEDYVRLQQAAKLQDASIFNRIRRIREARITLDDPILRNFHLLDTPGFNHDEEMDGKTLEILDEADIIFWIADYTAVAKASETGVLERIRSRGIPAWLVVNKGDMHVNSTEAHAKATQKLSRFFSQNGFLGYFESEEVHLISSTARDALWDGIFAQFRARLGAMVLEQDMRLSVQLIANEFRRLCSALQDELDWLKQVCALCDKLETLLDPGMRAADAKAEIVKTAQPRFSELLDRINAHAKQVRELPDSGVPAVKSLAMAITRKDLDQDRAALEGACAGVLQRLHADHIRCVSARLAKGPPLIPDGQGPLRRRIEILAAYYRELEDLVSRAPEPPPPANRLPALTRVTEVIDHIAIQFGGFAWGFTDQVEELGVLRVNETAAALDSRTYGRLQLEHALFEDIEHEVRRMCRDPVLAAASRDLRQLTDDARTRLGRVEKQLGKANDDAAGA